MAAMTTTEPGHTKFNLTYPVLPFNGAGLNLTSPGVNGTETENHDSSVIPGILFGILVPHIVCTVFILARTYSRLRLLRKWFPDDTLIVLAWIFSTTVCIVYSVAAKSPRIRDAVAVSTGSNRSVSDSDSDSDSGNGFYYDPNDEIQPYILRTYIGLICYQLCLCITKLSVLAFYLRMFSGSRPLERRLAWATVILVILYGVPLLFMSIFQCHPATGEFFDSPLKCFTFVPLLITSASLHTATDAWLILLIIPCIVRLDLPPRQKVALAVVLSLSIFVIAASMTRLQLSLRANYRPSGDGVQVADTLAFFVMTVLECDIALICASAPTLRPVLARLWPKLGMGENPKQAGRQRRSWMRGRRRSGIGGRDVEDDGSVNLTTVVSYHGYPWTEPNTPRAGRSRNGSALNMDKHAGSDMQPPVPHPQPAFLMHRTPTTLSLRSFMSSMAPRSRGATLSGRRTPGEDREGLLADDDGDEIGVEQQQRRRSSVGFEGYYDQYLPAGEKRLSRTMQKKRDSLTNAHWGDSQESFVLGMNDPNSPTARLSPVSITDSKLSGATLTDRIESPSKKDGEGGRPGNIDRV
ncbi:hypothetical protein QBC46DRAFT_445121 [Diplogelasinospora grovesii]|uniref:Rhodopsin domain-containing protein n=1 Tax=Diplogelasinospora grovesii TaxID=303347 RepID=A0AAN6NJ36_9PEZI|nr:hypothetical protein QBC46DRAFT_445121 [Diplogelasinospora grovesii]